jgi:hypothetical protein
MTAEARPALEWREDLLPPTTQPIERANAVAAIATGYARRLQGYADQLAAQNDRCAGEAQRNADAFAAWATAREEALAGRD